MTIIKKQFIQFIIMFIVGVMFNPMNMLAFRLNDLYLSLTLIYGGLLMASNMIWAHEIIHYFIMGHLNKYVFITGILLSIFTFTLLRKQILINDKQWLRRMISHHSTALTTTHKIINNTNNIELKKIADDIITTQEKEIKIMKTMLQN